MSMDPDSDRRAALAPLFKAGEERPPSSTVKVTIGARSHHGVVRETNEDHYLVLRLGRDQETLATSLSGSDVPPPFKESAYTMLVADGLGEGGSGSVASRVALSTIAHLALDCGEWNVRVDAATASQIYDRAEWFYAQADTAVHTRAASSPLLKGMTTALTAAYSAGTDLFITHVGHSRAYLFRGGELVLLTRDHTVAEHLAHSTRPAAVERRAQDLRHILTDAIGAAGGHPLVEVERFRLVDGDIVMLCTNGLTDMVNDDKIAEVLARRRAPDEQCATLIDLANRAGGGDNITVVMAEYHINVRD
jgi:serine/threonine protein phosphatase PrpC